MNNISKMSARIMLFEKETEKKLYKIAKYNGIKFSYYYGYIVEFDKANVDGITPHTLIFSKKEKELIVLYYGIYHKNDDLFIVEGKMFSLLAIKNILEIILKTILI